MVETLTPEMIDQMPAGPEMNALIDVEIFGAIPLSDDEWEIARAVYMMCHGPNATPPMDKRFMRIPLDEPQYGTGFMFYLRWPSDYSKDTFGASRQIVEKMRADGWLYELSDGSHGIRVVRFIHIETMGKYQGGAIAETEALAICRAALSAKLALNKRGEK